MEHSSYTLEELKADTSFNRWIEGRAHKEESKFWDRWVVEDEKNFQLARQAEAELLEFSFQDTDLPPVEPEWQNLRAHLLNLSQGSTPSRKSNNSWKWLFRAAAVLIVGLVTGVIALVIYQPLSPSTQTEMVKKTITTGFGEKKTVHFSDGSEVILNANSMLSYQPNSDLQRGMLVELEGEAFFSVVKRATSNEAVFSVQTTDGKISVLGTRFVVSTRDDQTQVVLEEGLVSMNPMADGEDQKAEEKYLRPGELAQFDRDRDSILIKKVNPQVYTSWSTSTLVFDQTPLRDVAKRIEHTFGVDVVITDPQLPDQKISGSVENSELEVIVSALSNTMMIPVKIKDERVYIGDSPSHD